MILRFLAILALLIATIGVRAQESMVTEVSYPFLEKLIATAKANYPRVRALQNRVNVAQMNVKKTRLDWFNIFTFTYLYSPNNSTTLVNPNLLNGYQVGFFTSVGNILQKPINVKSAREELNVTVMNQEEYLLNLEAQVKQRYYTYIQQLTILNWRTKSIQSAESSVNDLKYKFGKGEETFENYNKALGYYANTVQFKIEAEGALLIAKSNLEELLGAKLESIK